VHISGIDGKWTVSDVGGQTSCAKDEAPLAWAATEALNTRSLAPLDIYTQSSAKLTGLLNELGVLPPRAYLPLINK